MEKIEKEEDRLIKLEERIKKFTLDRDWTKFHTPSNLAKSIVIEASELLECFQWNQETDFTHVNEELADVLIYCLQMVDILGVDAKQIIFEKLEKNALKYPIEK